MNSILEKIFSVKNSFNKKHKVVTVFGVKLKFQRKISHNFSLNSGERQTATSIDGIRKDHIYRYEKGIEAVKKYLQLDKIKNGADVFCGNGYGSFLISNAIPNVKLLSIDGSKEAIILAKKHYNNNNVRFEHKLFPFSMKKNKYDFIFSLESIEHVKNDDKFLHTLTSAIRDNGILILSTPNADKIDLNINPNPFHFRHYHSSYIINLLKKQKFELLEIYGQDTYIIDSNKKVIGSENPENMNLHEGYDGQFIIYIFVKNLEKNIK